MHRGLFCFFFFVYFVFTWTLFTLKHFRRKGSLNLHIQTMHSGREKKVRAPKPPRLPRQKATKECHICNKVRSIIVLLFIIWPYICLQVFKKRAYLKLHMLVHTGEQPFECPQCHKVRKSFILYFLYFIVFFLNIWVFLTLAFPSKNKHGEASLLNSCDCCWSAN